ncbi:MAG: hypothetical protein JNL01_12645 [Bdellovibrionales bacterium]|nr:hypothetical protein [Bdellovibrionales bacterium]
MGIKKGLRHHWIFSQAAARLWVSFFVLIPFTACRSKLNWLAFSGTAVGTLTFSSLPGTLLKGACSSALTLTRAMKDTAQTLPAGLVYLQSSKGGYFYTNADCTGWLDQVSFLEGQSSVTLYYQPWGSWNYELYGVASDWDTLPGTLNVISSTVDLNNSYVTISSPTVTAGNTVTLTVYMRDSSNAPITTYEPWNNMRVRTRQALFSTGYSRVYFTNQVDTGGGVYTVDVVGMAAGAANTIEVVIGGTGTLQSTANITVTPNTFSSTTSTIHISNGHVPYTGAAVVTLYARDTGNNPISVAGLNCTEGDTSTPGISRATFDATPVDQGGGVYTLNAYGTTQGTPNTIVCQVPGFPIIATQPSFTVSRVQITSGPPQTTWWTTAAAGAFQVSLSLQGTLTGGDTLVCRLKKPSDGSTAFTPCDGSTGMGTTFTRTNPGTSNEGLFEFEAGVLPFAASSPIGVIKKVYYMHSSLANRVGCTAGPSDQQFMDKAKQILGLPNSTMDPGTQLNGPIMNYTRNRSGYVQFSEARTLRKRMAQSADRSYLVIRRTYYADSGLGCAMRFVTQGSGINLNGGLGNQIHHYNCDAMVVDSDGRAVCLDNSLGLVKAFGSFRIGNGYRSGSTFTYPFKVKGTTTEVSNPLTIPRNWSGIELYDF